MKKYLLLTTALAFVGTATTAQAGCSDNNPQVTRLNPTELSGYQKCWLQEHRPEEPSGVIGNLFYFETVKGEYFSTTVESLIKMKPDAASEYVTSQVVSATMDRVEEIMKEDGTLLAEAELQDVALDLEQRIENEIIKADKLVRQQKHLEETIDLLESAALEDIEVIQGIKEQIAANEQTIASLEKFSANLQESKYVGGAEEVLGKAERSYLERSLKFLEKDNAELTTDLKTARDALRILINSNIADRNDLKAKHRLKVVEIETQRDDVTKLKDALVSEKHYRDQELLRLASSLKSVNAELDDLKQEHEASVKKLEGSIKHWKKEVRGLDMDVEDARELQIKLEKQLDATREARNDNAKALRATNDKIEEFLNDAGFTWNKSEDEIHAIADVASSARSEKFHIDVKKKSKEEAAKAMESFDAFGNFGSMEGKYVQFYATMDDGKEYIETDNFGDVINGFPQREITFSVQKGGSKALGLDEELKVKVNLDDGGPALTIVALVEASVRQAVENTVKEAVDQIKAAYDQGYKDGYIAGYEEGFRDGYLYAAQDFQVDAKDQFKDDGGQ